MLCRKGKGKEAKLGYAGHLLMAFFGRNTV